MMRVDSYIFKNGWNREIDITKDSSRTLLLCFGNIKRSEELREAYFDMVKKFPSSHVVGCSTAGEIKDGEYYEESLVVAVIQFGKSSIHVVNRKFERSDNLVIVGKDILEELIISKEDLRSVLLFSEGIDVNGSRLVRGMDEILPSNVILSGGLAGDGVRFEETFVYHKESIKRDSIVAIGIYGKDLFVKSNYKCGWDRFGIERKITSAKDNILYTLNDEPALKIYKRYLGDYSNKLPASALLFPLFIKKNRGDERSKIRIVLKIDEENQAMVFTGDIPESGYATFMKTNSNKLIEAASLVASELIDDEELPSGGEFLCLSISCVGRHLVLKHRTEEELEAIFDVLPENFRQIGFYSYGEVSSLYNRKCDLNNQTVIITLLGEL